MIVGLELEPELAERNLYVFENMVARDGIEPPTPAFSGPPTEQAKWFEINAWC